jgi:hypothetical protein
MTHVLWQSVYQEPQRDIDGTLHKHRVAVLSRGRKGFLGVVSMSQIRRHLFQCCSFRYVKLLT